MIMEKYGVGEHSGIIFEERFYSAIHRPKSVLFGQEVHPTLWEKAAALTQSIIQEHPFHNGNKRTAFMCLLAFLDVNEHKWNLSPEESEELMVRIAVEEQFKGNTGVEKLGETLREYIVTMK